MQWRQAQRELPLTDAVAFFCICLTVVTRGTQILWTLCCLAALQGTEGVKEEEEEGKAEGTKEEEEEAPTDGNADHTSPQPS